VRRNLGVRESVERRRRDLKNKKTFRGARRTFAGRERARLDEDLLVETATGGLDVGGHGVREGRGALADDLGAARGDERGVVADAKPGERL